jgi:hypothetical protein
MMHIPPHADSSNESDSILRCVHVRLTDRYRWKVVTPTFLRIREGVVERVATSVDALESVASTEMYVGNRPTSMPPSLPSTLSAFPDYQVARRNRYLAELACGPLSLITVLRKLGVSVSGADEERLIAQAGTAGTDFHHLKAMADEMGVYSMGVAISEEHLFRLAIPAVIHNGQFGFSAITAYTSDGAQIAQPFMRRAIIPNGQMAKHFGEPIRALLISQEPLSPDRIGVCPPPHKHEAGPRLRLERTMVAVGRIYRHHWEATLKLFNDGDRSLRIKSVTASCGHVRATADDREVLPGCHSVLRVRGNQEQVGGDLCRVRISTNQSPNSETVVPVRVFLEQAVTLERPVVTMEGVRPNERAKGEIDYEIAEGYRAEQVRVTIPPGAAIEVKVLAKGLRRGKLDISWLGTALLGWHRIAVDVRPDGLPDSAASTLLVAVHVHPRFTVYPKAIWVREEELDKNWRRKVTLDLPGGTSLGRVEFSDPKVSPLFTVVREGVGAKTSVVVTPRRAGVGRLLTGKVVDLVAHLSPDSCVTIPMSFGRKAAFGDNPVR